MVSFAEDHVVPLTRAATAVEFARDVLSATPWWLSRTLAARDQVLKRMGFAVQADEADVLDLRVGGAAGPFTFSRVDDEVVVGGAVDRHIGFESTFFVTSDPGYALGHLRTQAQSNSWVGQVYLYLVWPCHRLLMGRVLAAGAGTSGLRRG